MPEVCRMRDPVTITSSTGACWAETSVATQAAITDRARLFLLNGLNRRVCIGISPLTVLFLYFYFFCCVVFLGRDSRCSVTRYGPPFGVLGEQKSRRPGITEPSAGG